MNITIDASRAFVPKRTGTENYSYQLIKAIAKIDRKNQYTLYTRFPNVIASDRRERSNLINGLNSNFTFKNISLSHLWTQFGLAREVFFNPPDVLFVPSHTLPLIRSPGLKTVVTIHDLGYEYLPEYHQFPQKLYLNKSTELAVKQATRLIAVSKATKKDLINKLNCPADKITVVYEGFDKEKFKPVTRHSGDPAKGGGLQNRFWTSQNDVITKPYILFAGTLQPRKNIERLIEAFSLLLRSFPNNPKHPNTPNLVIAGNKGWLYDKILSAPKKFGVEKRVKFLGYTSDEDLAKLYSRALCFCLPSLFEGFGLPVLEAMACGCPVVVSKTSSLPEVAGEAGLYVNPYNVDDIAEKLASVIKNEKLRAEMKQKSLKQARKFSWEKCARETIDILEKTASSSYKSPK